MDIQISKLLSIYEEESTITAAAKRYAQELNLVYNDSFRRRISKIINKEVLSYLGLGVNSTVADFEKAAIKKLIFMSKRITALEARVTVLETP